jgi:hypothetical protein
MFGKVIVFIALVTGIALAGPQDEAVTLDNGTMCMSINVHGGAVSSCKLNKHGLNPFSWKAKRHKGNPSIKEGLFICFDRLGKPSKDDLEKGIPFHGEATGVRWEVLEQKTSEAGDLMLKMRCRLPVAKMSLVREYCLFKDSSVCRITDRIKNGNPVKKTYNVLQHPSLAPPFLDNSVMVDCNAHRGFLNVKDVSKIPGPTIGWPEINYQSKPLNLRFMKDGNGLVANYVCNESVAYGWGCVSNPKRNLLVGCLWPTKDYPWTRVWREWNQDAPKSLGVEFSTTPLGIPLEEVEQVGDLFGHATIESLDPDAETVKTFYLFLSEIPKDFAGVGNVSLSDGILTIRERDSEGKREWLLPCGNP